MRFENVVAVIFALSSAAASAQTFPAKPVNMVIPFAAGGPTDTLGRNLGVAWGKLLKQTVIVENVGGAGGNIGVTRIARAAPDGYNILLHHIGMSTSPALYRKLDYDPLNDFEYIGLVADVPMTLIARANFPAKDFTEFLAYIKANKAKLSLANAGLGAASHLCGLLFMSAIQTDFTTVPYKGTGPAMNDLLGGQVDFMCDQTTNTTGQIKGGKVKVYGVTSLARVASLPEVPTLNEQGMKGFEVAVWHGVCSLVAGRQRRRCMAWRVGDGGLRPGYAARADAGGRSGQVPARGWVQAFSVSRAALGHCRRRHLRQQPGHGGAGRHQAAPARAAPQRAGHRL